VEFQEVLPFSSLGLTSNQIRVYFALFRFGLSTAKTISQNSGIARSDVYRVVAKLENLGLVERMISVPCKFRAVSIHDAFSILMEHRKQETKTITRKAQKLLRGFKNYENENTVQDYRPQFVWIAEKGPYIRKRREEIDNAQTSVDFVTSWKRLPLTAYTFGEKAEEALRRGVKMRVVMEKPPQSSSLPRIIKKLGEYPNYNLRFILDPPLAVIGIFDRKRVILDCSSSVGLAECPALWSTNPSYLAVMQNYFEKLWMQASSQH
jgi:sugar-specific transcriptional regulator TrmB